ncbi:PLP-dependent transferase [Laetiporus sulphureus 93-53]|uniref:PLP-dependent transferase n=1 Tax=Laetiporus sulphureus 93-53 TaxID=1314785 RepID=A0A165DTI8_9APHY|nr:PLP-dependent transferase [Laetiporus sulphureus 93-53]KZT05602.1 PLP-dependent transferase [Laetiporus sulphureus 93-53]
MTYENRQKAIDLSHHLSELSKARATSPLKGLARYYGRPGLISLAGGVPDENYFPFNNIGGDAIVPNAFSLKADEQDSGLSWFWKLFGRPTKEKTIPITIPRWPEQNGDVNLAQALQYGMATGLPQLQKFIKDFVEKVYQPAYSDCTIMVHIGNTEGWSRTMQTLMNPGEGFITEEWSFPTAMAASIPYGMHAIPVEMDGDGMSSACLRKVLSEWDEKARGCKRPHVMYTVPVGQNPCGSTMGATRKKEIYDICVEFGKVSSRAEHSRWIDLCNVVVTPDIIIVEDDPYFFLQQGGYVPKTQRSSESHGGTSDAEWLAGLAPSYLKFDYQGRVIRLDTFSKYIAPGSRLGWHTCNPLFAERLERHGETTAQAPCGFGQSLVTQLLLTWKQDGYVRWLRGLAVQYKSRRDFFIDCLGEEFHLVPSSSEVSYWKGCDVFDAYAKTGKELVTTEKGAIGTRLFSFVPPSSGMFIWMRLFFGNLPAYRRDPEETPELQLWTKLADAGVLISPGWFFAADTLNPPTDEMEGHYRISFSNADFEALKKAVQIFAKVTKDFFEQ